VRGKSRIISENLSHISPWGRQLISNNAESWPVSLQGNSIILKSSVNQKKSPMMKAMQIFHSCSKKLEKKI